MKLNRNEYNALLRHDFSALPSVVLLELNPQSKFKRNWHLELMAAELEKCRLGQNTRLIINVPPRSLKSHCASVAFPGLASRPQSECPRLFA